VIATEDPENVKLSGFDFSISAMSLWDKRPMDHVSLWVLVGDRQPLYLGETTTSLSHCGCDMSPASRKYILQGYILCIYSLRIDCGNGLSVL
jgi:hypothetical protein